MSMTMVRDNFLPRIFGGNVSVFGGNRKEDSVKNNILLITYIYKNIYDYIVTPSLNCNNYHIILK